MTGVTEVHVGALPSPKGHYSHAVRAGGLIFISGQLPAPADGSEPPADLAGQARIALANLLAILSAAGGAPKDLAKVTVYLVGIEHWDAFNRIYAEAMGDARPARAVVPVAALHHGFLVEIEAIAAVG
jgi:2-iminobutanoate/2-iminopropanoate deaminase